MEISNSFVVDHSPDGVWDFARRPAGMGRAASPMIQFEAVDPGSFPDRWQNGSYIFDMRLLGAVPLGRYRTTMSIDDDPGPPFRLVDDGSIGPISTWRHEIVIADAGMGTARWTDRIVIDAGTLTPIVATLGRLFLILRSYRLRQLLSGLE